MADVIEPELSTSPAPTFSEMVVWQRSRSPMPILMDPGSDPPARPYLYRDSVLSIVTQNAKNPPASNP